jgi:hypothetical protein
MYGDSFFHRRKKLIWRAPILCEIIKEIFPGAKSIIDVGCAIGEFVHQFQKMGISSEGIEGSESALKYASPETGISLWDIRTPLPTSKTCIGKTWNLCMCLEVAEHIEEEYTNIFIDNLCFLSNTILISAAPPGQQGYGHFNCQKMEYWEIKFGIRDYRRRVEKEKRFKSLLEPYKRKKGLSGYYNNIMIYEHNDIILHKYWG